MNKKTKTHTRQVKSDHDKRLLMDYIANLNQPFAVTFHEAGEKRRDAQNRLMHLWFKEAGEQGDLTAIEQKSYCKAYFGVPILLFENEAFRNQYNAIVRPLSHEKKLQIMAPPIDLPVTSLMTVKQCSKFLNEVWLHYSQIGFQLTDPAALGLEDLFKRCGDGKR